MPYAPPSNIPKLQSTRTPDHRYAKGLRHYNWGHKDNRRWRAEAKAFILANPKCSICRQAIIIEDGKPVNACVDHEPAHKGDERMFWDRRTWRAAHVAPCHNSKTARVDR